MTPLAGKRIILTGGSGGLGQLVAAALVREGVDLTVMSRSRPAGATDALRHVAADLSTPQGIAAAALVVAGDTPDILINMAGVQYFGPAEQQSFDALLSGYLINLVAPAELCRACLPAMKRRNSGQIVNIGSILGSIAFAHFSAYSSAKAGLRAFSEALRRELAGTAVGVTYVAPRAAKTAMLTPAIKKYAELTGMTVDPPEIIADRIVAAIRRRRKDVYIGFPEQIFVRLNAVLPRLVDAAVAGTDRKAAGLFTV